MPELYPVFSTHIEAVGHDAEMGELHVRWKTGRTSVYEGVTAAEAERIRKAPSVGEELRPVKATARHRYVG